MEPFLIRLLITIGVIFIIQSVLSVVTLKEPAPRLIMGITILVMVIWLMFGYTFFNGYIR